MALNLKTLMQLRQSRAFTGETVDRETIDRIIEVARWSGSSRNKQPWHLIVVDDRELLGKLAHVREMNAWSEDAAFLVVIAMDGTSPSSEMYDQGRMSERIMLAAHVLGLGSGTCWYTKKEEIAAAKDLLGLPDHLDLKQFIAIGKIAQKPGSSGSGGRKPVSEIASLNRYGEPLA